MTHPAVIRTDFVSAEEAAQLYGMPKSRVEAIRRALTAEKRVATRHRSPKKSKRVSRGKKRLGKGK
jgi:hypothetical protein